MNKNDHVTDGGHGWTPLKPYSFYFVDLKLQRCCSAASPPLNKVVQV